MKDEKKKEKIYEERGIKENLRRKGEERRKKNNDTFLND